MRSLFKVLSVIGLGVTSAACQNHANVQYETNPNCDLTGGGVCAAASTGNRWCAYPDASCPGGYRFTDQDVGDGVGGACVTQTDAGIDMPPDATIDGRLVDASLIDADTTPRCRVAFEDGPAGTFPGQGTREIWIAKTDGTGLVNVSNDPGDDFGPSWAPDGMRLAFASNRRGLATSHSDLYDIWLITLPGDGRLLS
jgi:hypothetical protein